VKVEATWIPWTHSRLSYRSGYGAGVTAPGWYQHLWTAPQRATAPWVSRAAHLLRHERLDAPASGVIDSVRLAETLAALRGRRQPGLAELRDAILTVLCQGEGSRLALVVERLEVGEVMGAVPAEAPTVPLQRDVELQARRLRLHAAEDQRTLDLDLRRDLDHARSVFLHRLRLLEVPWGRVGRSDRGTRGTFRETWLLQWSIELPLLLIEKNVWGNTLTDAAGAYVPHLAAEAALPRLTELLRDTVLAELPDAIARLLSAVQELSALTSDVLSLMNTLLPLAEVARYGDVRGTSRREQVLPILDGLFERVLISLPGACLALDDAAAEAMVGGIGAVERSVALLDRPIARAEWVAVLRDSIERDAIHSLVRGWCCRLLLESGTIDGTELQRLAGLALAHGVDAASAAAWIEGLLRGSGLALMHHDGVWAALDGWLRTLDEDTFVATLPVLRRGFSGFQPAGRRQMGEKVKRLGGAPAAASDGVEAIPTLHHERAGLVLPVLREILGGGKHGD
jgi:hypothetical protein